MLWVPYTLSKVSLGYNTLDLGQLWTDKAYQQLKFWKLPYLPPLSGVQSVLKISSIQHSHWLTLTWSGCHILWLRSVWAIIHWTLVNNGQIRLINSWNFESCLMWLRSAESNQFSKLVQFNIHFDWLWHVLGAIFFKFGLIGLYYSGPWVITFRLSISTVEIFLKSVGLGSAETLWVPEISSIQDSLWLTLTCSGCYIL